MADLLVKSILKMEFICSMSACMCCLCCIPGAAENVAERKQQRTDAECQPYVAAPSLSLCEDR